MFPQHFNCVHTVFVLIVWNIRKKLRIADRWLNLYAYHLARKGHDYCTFHCSLLNVCYIDCMSRGNILNNIVSLPYGPHTITIATKKKIWSFDQNKYIYSITIK